MIHNLTAYRSARLNPFAVWFDFWATAWTVFLPRVHIEAKIYKFPIRSPKP